MPPPPGSAPTHVCYMNRRNQQFKDHISIFPCLIQLVVLFFSIPFTCTYITNNLYKNPKIALTLNEHSLIYTETYAKPDNKLTSFLKQTCITYGSLIQRYTGMVSGVFRYYLKSYACLITSQWTLLNKFHSCSTYIGVIFGVCGSIF